MVLALAYFPGGGGLATGGYDGPVRIWTAAGGEAVATLRGHPGGVTALAFHPASGVLFSAGFDRAVRQWPVGSPLATLARSFAPQGGVAGVSVSPDGKSLVTTRGLFTLGLEPEARVWDVATGRERGRIVGHSGGVLGAEYTPDGRRVLTWANDGTLRLWDAASLAPVAVVPIQGRSPVFMPHGVTPDGTRLITSASGNSVVVWDLPGPGSGAGQGVPELQPGRTLFEDPNLLVTALSVSPDGKAVAASMLDREAGSSAVSVRDLADGRERARLSMPGRAPWRPAFSPDGRRLACGLWEVAYEGEPGLVVWDATNWAQAALLPPRAAAQPARPATVADRNVRLASIFTLTFTPDGSNLVLADGRGSVAFRDPATLELRGEVGSRAGAVTGLAFAAGGRTFVTAAYGENEPVEVWVHNGRPR
jgi:WD40 repeat protein